MKISCFSRRWFSSIRKKDNYFSTKSKIVDANKRCVDRIHAKYNIISIDEIAPIQETLKIPDGIRETARLEGLLKPVERENRRTRRRGEERGESVVERVAGEKRRSHCNRTPTNEHRVPQCVAFYADACDTASPAIYRMKRDTSWERNKKQHPCSAEESWK